MATVLTNDANYTAIANAIRAKGGEGTFTPAQMATAIANLPSGGASNKVLTSAIITGTSSTMNMVGNFYIIQMLVVLEYKFQVQVLLKFMVRVVVIKIV